MGTTVRDDVKSKAVLTHVPEWLYDIIVQEKKANGSSLSEVVRDVLVAHYTPPTTAGPENEDENGDVDEDEDGDEGLADDEPTVLTEEERERKSFDAALNLALVWRWLDRQCPDLSQLMQEQDKAARSVLAVVRAGGDAKKLDAALVR